MTDIQHTISVSMLSWRIGKQMGMSEQDCAILSVAGILHDIGKMCIPPALLDKPGSLTPDEYKIIQLHTTMGQLMLSSMPDDIHKLAGGVCLNHHELWDGSGYPHGLRGEEIPLMARIVTVADVYDALVSDRAYRRAWPVEKAKAYLRENADRLFDGKVVGALIQSF